MPESTLGKMDADITSQQNNMLRKPPEQAKWRCEQEEATPRIWGRCTGEEWVGCPWRGPEGACGEGPDDWKR